MKKIIFVIIIIIAGILIGTIITGYFGNYPSFFPDFIKYNKFLPQIVTENVFEIKNFIDPEEDFPTFLKEVESEVHKSWRKEAKLGYISAHFVLETNKESVAYELFFGSEKPYCHGLRVFYNAEAKIEKGPYLADSLYRRGHAPEFNANRTLIAIEFIEPDCLYGINQESVEKIKISGKQAFQSALAKKPELINVYEENPWFGWLRHTTEDTRPYWKILGTDIKVDAETGKILE